MARKLLEELKVAELKSELEERDLDTTGLKADLVKRLKEALIVDGIDPSTYKFQITGDIASFAEELKNKMASFKSELAIFKKQMRDKLLGNAESLGRIVDQKIQENSLEDTKINGSKINEKENQPYREKEMDDESKTIDKVPQLSNIVETSMNGKLADSLKDDQIVNISDESLCKKVDDANKNINLKHSDKACDEVKIEDVDICGSDTMSVKEPDVKEKESTNIMDEDIRITDKFIDEDNIRITDKFIDEDSGKSEKEVKKEEDETVILEKEHNEEGIAQWNDSTVRNNVEESVNCDNSASVDRNNSRNEILNTVAGDDSEYESLDEDNLEEKRPGEYGSECDDRERKIHCNAQQPQEEIACLEQKIERMEATSREDNATDVRIGNPRNIMKPPQFDGKSSWANYLRQFEAAAKTNGWTPKEKVVALTLALRGDAADVLQTLAASDLEDCDRLLKCLEARYGSERLKEMYRCQLGNRQQKSNGTLQEFEVDMLRLVRLAYPETPEVVLERLATRAFAGGLLGVEMEQAVLLSGPRTIAMYAEVRGVNIGDAEQPLTPAEVRRTVEEVLAEKRKKPIEGWSCGKIGHIRSQCWKRKQGSGASCPVAPPEGWGGLTERGARQLGGNVP